MHPTSILIQSLVKTCLPALRGAEPEKTAQPADGGWNARQLLGHLIDSAANNHGRFIRAQWSDDLVCPTYDQEAWVSAQGYQDADWNDLLDLWAAYNLHLARVIDRIPADARLRSRLHHNLDRVAWQTVPADTPVTLEYFLADYAAHLQHHIRDLYYLTGLQPPADIP